MQELLALLPMPLYFILGFVLRHFNVLKKSHADQAMNLSFYLVAPPMVLFSVWLVDLNGSSVLLPLCAFLMIGVLYAAATLLSAYLGLGRKTKGTFVIAPSILNLGFTMPFFAAAYGVANLGFVSLLDLGNTLLLYSLIYGTAAYYGAQKPDYAALLKKMLFSPMAAILLGLGLNLAGIAPPDFSASVLNVLVALFALISFGSAGVYFMPKLRDSKLIATLLGFKLVLGLALAGVLVWLLPLSPYEKIVLILAGAAPLGFKSITFSVIEKLDVELASQAVPLSVAVSSVLFIFLLTSVL